MPHHTNENTPPEGASLSLDDRSLADVSIHAIETIARAASTHAIEAYLVGGMVRDIVAKLPRITTAPDVTIIGEASTFAEALAVTVADCTPISVSQHHTVKVKIGDVMVDIASARTDTYEPWGSLPQITLVSDIESDLKRRDFTANAMAIRLTQAGFGELIDPYDGRSDVAKKIMRVIRKDSFDEDPLRIMRGIRLAARYGYTFDYRTSESIQRSLHRLRNMCDTSPQRVFNEFRLWFRSHENLDELVSIAAEYGILNVLLPGATFEERIFGRIPADAAELERFAGFAYLSPPETMCAIAEKLMMPSEWRAVIIDAHIAHSVAERCRTELITDVELRRSLADVRDQVVRAAIHAESDRDVANRFIDFRNQLRDMRTALNGDDLIALGVERGPMVGELLDELLALRVERSISNAAEERAYVIRRLTDG